MFGATDLKNGIRSDTLGNYRTLFLISHVHKTVFFSFGAFGAVKLLLQNPANSQCGRLSMKGATFFIHSV